MTKIIVTESENETMLAGEELAKEILEIDKDRSIVIFLEGELGAGKTTLTKGILKGLNYDEVVTSLLITWYKYMRLKGSRSSISTCIE